MKNALNLLVAFMLLTACSNPHPTNAQTSQENYSTTIKMEKMNAEKNQIVNVALFYLKEGQEKKFEEFRAKGGVLLEKYGARIERVIKPTMIAQGELESPDEIHFAFYPNQAAFDAFNQDPEFLKLKETLVLPSVEKMYAFPTQLSDFEFTREIGDRTKTFGVALVYFKDGEQYEKQFGEYHDEVCEIIPEFGAHFERFLVPVAANGELEKPDEIHRFYFDTPEGMQQMVSDERMLKLFPKRDASLSNLIFILGEAL